MPSTVCTECRVPLKMLMIQYWTKEMRDPCLRAACSALWWGRQWQTNYKESTWLVLESRRVVCEMSGMSVRILDRGAGWECLLMRAWSQWGKETCTYPVKNLPDRTSSIEFLRLKHSWLRTFAFILSEVRSHGRVLSEGTVIGLCLIKQPWVLCGEQFWPLKT